MFGPQLGEAIPVRKTTKVLGSKPDLKPGRIPESSQFQSFQPKMALAKPMFFFWRHSFFVEVRPFSKRHFGAPDLDQHTAAEGSQGWLWRGLR
jgi:hypothetical protein